MKSPLTPDHPTYPARRGPSPARTAALHALSGLREGRLSAREAIDVVGGGHGLSSQDRNLTTELVMGVVRHRLTLARLLSLFTTRGWQRVAEDLQQILMLAAYQIVWLDSIPAFAAVDEAVEQAKQVGGSRTGSFVNGVLRSLIRDIETRRLPIGDADPRRSAILDREMVCHFRRPFLPDPQENPVGYWADATSHPTWLVGQWRDAYGLDGAIQICLAGITRPPTILRPNRLRTTTSELAELLSREGITTCRLPEDIGLVTEPGPSPLQTRAFEDGLFQPQDRTSIQVLPSTCQPALQPGSIVVDICAGLGTKTTQFAELTQDKGVILATDKDPGKLELLRANALRLGCQSIQIIPFNKLIATVAAAGGAHCVLVDAPCSNSGVLARRPEARYRITSHTQQKLAELQTRVLFEASELLRPEGRLVYATCSIDPQENEDVASQFSEHHPTWKFIGSQVTLPGSGPAAVDWQDGGFWAVWQKPA